jgi:hypothetical protein
MRHVNFAATLTRFGHLLIVADHREIVAMQPFCVTPQQRRLALFNATMTVSCSSLIARCMSGMQPE